MNKLLLIFSSLLITFGYIDQEMFGKKVVEEPVLEQDSLVTLSPKPEHPSETFVIVNLLSRYHYRKVDLNDSLSSVIFDSYIKILDPNKSYFLASDLDYFEKYRHVIDDQLPEGNVDLAYQIFATYRERSLERIAYVKELLKKEFDFSQNEFFETDREKLPWPETREEQNEVWRKLLKNQALSYKMAGKEWPDIAEALSKRYERIEKAIYQYNSEDVYQAYMNAFTTSFDPHTDYFSPIAKENFQIDMSLSLEGIGARLTQQLDYTKVAEIIPGGPAYKSKELQKDDKIIGVAQGDDGEFEDIIGWRIDDVVQKIRGKKGTVVRLQVLRHNEDIGSIPDTVRIVRDKVKLEESAAKSEVIPIIDGNQTYKLGVITIPSFYIDFEEMNNGVKDYKSTTRDVKELIEELKEQDIDGLLIDLRYNGGGSLQEAIELTGLFIPQGPVVQVRDTDNSVEVMDDEDAGVFYNGPLAVLTNRYSASASEIFSGAIQDYKRGVILGENTFGKGTVQNLIDIERYLRRSDTELGQLKMTLAKFYRVTGSSTQNIGVQPDISFPSPYDDEAFGESSMPNALPWDEIKSTDFRPANKIDPELIAKLKKLYRRHLNEDEDLKELAQEVERIKEARDETSVSLNLEQRKTEQAKFDEQPDLSTTINTSEVVNGEELIKKLSEDPYLKEGLRLLAELSKQKVG